MWPEFSPDFWDQLQVTTTILNELDFRLFANFSSSLEPSMVIIRSDCPSSTFKNSRTVGGTTYAASPSPSTSFMHWLSLSKLTFETLCVFVSKSRSLPHLQRTRLLCEEPLIRFSASFMSGFFHSFFSDSGGSNTIISFSDCLCVRDESITSSAGGAGKTNLLGVKVRTVSKMTVVAVSCSFSVEKSAIFSIT